MIDYNCESYKHEVEKPTKCCHPDSFSIICPSRWPEICPILISVELYDLSWPLILTSREKFEQKRSTTFLWKHFQNKFWSCQIHNPKCINNASNKLDYKINRSHRTFHQPSAMWNGPYGSFSMTHIWFVLHFKCSILKGSIWNSFCNTNVIRLKSIHLISLIITVVKHHSIGIITW